MKLVFLDLDNTLIYSIKRISNVKDFTCVERYMDKDLSFMTNTSIEKLNKLMKDDSITIVPITTRVDYQFNRIKLPKFKYSLINNGGILLVDGKVDKNWFNLSLKYASSCIDELNKAISLLSADSNIDYDIKFLNNLFIFTKSNDVNVTSSQLRGSLDTSKVSVYNQGNKIYVVPNMLSKGNAIKRLSERIVHDTIISAGDNNLDFSMAKFSDVFITSNNSCREPNAVISKGSIFSDEILDYIGG